ncbi:MAG TPA: T9SS type A sorting domain-containing protein [Ignavibacteria bacterium]
MKLSYYLYDFNSVLKVTGESNDNTTVIDLSDLPAGLYILKVRSSQTLNTFKIIKQ